MDHRTDQVQGTKNQGRVLHRIGKRSKPQERRTDCSTETTTAIERSSHLENGLVIGDRLGGLQKAARGPEDAFRRLGQSTALRKIGLAAAASTKALRQRGDDVVT